MTPARLDIAIRRTIIDRGPQAIAVLERPLATPATGAVQSAFAAPAVALVMLRTMDPEERISWSVWAWGICIVSLRRSRRTGRQQGIRRAKSSGPNLRRAVDAAA
jgi:hypothetical protein